MNIFIEKYEGKTLYSYRGFHFGWLIRPECGTRVKAHTTYALVCVDVYSA